MEFKKINLQLFAENIANVNYTGSAGLSDEVKTFYEKQLIELAGPELVHDRFAQKKNIPANGGTSIEFRQFAPLTDDLEKLALVENKIPDGQDLVESKVTAQIADFGGYVKVSDKVELTAIDPILVQATKKIAEQAAKVMDKVTREKMLEGTNVYYCPKVTNGTETEVTARAQITADSLLRVKDVFRAAAILNATDAKTIDGSYVAIIHPHVAYDLMCGAGDAWMDIQKYSNADKIYNGEIGKIGNVRFVESSKAKIIGGAGANSANVYTTFFIAADAYATTEIAGGGVEHIFHGKGEIGGPLNQYSTVGWKARKTAEILVDDYLLRVESGSSMDDGSGKGN